MQGDLDFSAERARHPVLLGRVALLAAIERHISEGASCVLLRGTYGRGKSAVLCKLLERLERQGPVPHHFLRRSRAEWADPEAVAHSLARQILQQPTFRTLAGAATAGFIELLGRVSAEVLVPTRSRLVVVIYGLDEAERRVHEDPLARFVPRYPIEGVTLVCASRPTVDLSQLDAWSPRLLDLDSTAWRASNDRACHAFWRRARKPLALTAERAGDAARHAGGNLLYCVALHDHLAAMEPSVRGETALPAGLRGLLADAWRRAIAAAGDDVLAVRQGLALICAVRRPLALDYIADLAGCRDEAARGRFAAAIAPLVAEPQAEHPASSAVVQLRHDAFRQFVEGQLTAGELAAAHATLSKHLCAWPMKSPEVRAYGLAHGLSHLIAAGDWSGATQLGQNLERLLAQCRELGFELAEADLAFAAERCPEGDQRRRWRDLLHAVRDESHWLRKTPSALPTLLYNRLRTLGWSPDALAALPGMEQHGPAWRLRHPLRAQRGLLRTIARPGIDVNACVLTPDGTRVLAGDTHGNITVWETDTGREAGVLAGHESTITCLAITPDGRLAISGSDDRTVRVWDLATGLTRYVLRGARAPVSCCALVPGRGRIVIGAGRTLRILRLDGRGPATVLRGHRGDVKGCAVTPDGTHIASIADDQTVRVWTLDGKRIGVPLGDRSGIVCAFTPDGMGIISERNNLTITRWDPRSRPRHEVPVTTAEFGRVGLLIGCAMLAGERPVVLSSVQASVWMRDLHTGELYARLADGSASVPPCSISTDGRRAATASSDGMYSEILIWDIEAARQVTTDVPNGRVAHCGVSQDGRSVVTATDEELVAWSTHGGQREVS
ncbi:MAG TPA: WD40 repeat domain-containing protein, partial [Kofleriaceae bacterium]|nr:WD40 repeat domain-containing protein [Kofleriaceae bacterium]